ncbi:MAG: TonB-dependent receptor [Phenylobacterium sp.]|nr:MAG: TonB-dependent receptor [Phenylobacterium sp.]
MATYRKGRVGHLRLALLGASILAGGFASASAAAAQTAAQTASGTAVEEVVVTGIRKSLTDAAVAKETSTNFTDSIFAEDIGKFPDLNIAESLVRIPGVQLTRDIDGSGVQVSVRGLGPSFTKILLNGSQIAVASDGGTDAGNSNREVDLDMFPTELFTKLTVNKTPEAELLEGGVAGTVNLVNARAFDNEGRHFTYSAQGGYGDSARKFSPRGAFIASDTWGPFGALIGFAGSETKYRTDGFESIGWTTPNLSAAQCNTASCNTDGGKGFSFPATVPATAGNGLVAGTPIDAAFLAAHNPGTTLTQLGSALLPRLGRNSFSEGTKDHESVLISLEYKPSDRLHASLDMLWGHSDRKFNRLDMDWSVRNSNFMVPLNVQVDSNNVVTAGTFANSQFFLEARPYHETVDFYNINPSVTYDVNDWIHLEGQVNWNRSRFYREAPSFLFNSPLGVTVAYTNNGGDVPTITPSVDLGNPNLGWTWNRVNIQNVKRVTSDKGAHFDATFGDDKINIKAGLAYDDTFREIVAYDGSSAYQNCIINGAASTVNGVAVPCTVGNQVPNSAIASFLTNGPPGGGFFRVGSGNPGYLNFISLNYGAIEAASNYAKYNALATFSASSATATPSGNIDEKNTGGYLEINGTGQFMGRDVTYNAGIRYVSTKQQVTQTESVNNAFVIDTLEHDYDEYLPSFNVSAKLRDNLILRIAGSRTMTRPNPNVLLPGLTFSDPSAQVANLGNPNLAPFFSDNADLGLEYYTGGPGYVSLNLFHKTVTGFTVNQQISEPFSALGIPLSALSPTQQATGITANTIIAVNTQVNLGTSYIDGFEAIWVQPLDRFVKGLGFTANYTHLDTKAPTSTTSTSTGPLPGVPKFTYNLGAYYENYGVSVHLTYVYNDKLIAAAAPQNNVNLPLIADARGQLDLSASYTLPDFFGQKQMQVTFNATNLTNEPLRTVFGFENAPYSTYYPGRQFLIGLRGKF